MTRPQPLTPIQELWLHTLVANREKLGDMKPHWTIIEIIEHPAAIRLIDPVWRGDKLTLRVASLTHLPAIEKQEMMQSILAFAHQALADVAEVDLPRGISAATSEIQLDQLCQLLHCVPTNDKEPDVRWRKMGMLFYRHELFYSSLEDRPVCGICHGRVATGAGAQLEVAEQYGSGKTYRPNIHNECYRYAKLILLPQARAQREAAKLKETAEIDK